jgi:hypothetical protein
MNYFIKFGQKIEIKLVTIFKYFKKQSRP